MLANATFSGGSGAGGALSVDGTSSIQATYSNFYDNGATPFSGLGMPAGAGELAVAPQLADTTAADPHAWDLRLGVTSPLRDAGDPATADPDGTRADIGAYGGPRSF